MYSTLQKKVLISGASFAGLASAFWMTRLGYRVTLVEVASSLRRGGTAVNVRGNTIDVVRRMGILERIAEHRLSLERWEFKNADDITERSMVLRQTGEPLPDDDFEIGRDELLDILFDLVHAEVELVFDDSITSLSESEGGVTATFKRGSPRTFDLVLGCDGIHSIVRKLCFGEEAEFSHFLEQYFSITIVDKLLIEANTAQMFNVPGKAVMLNAYKNKTDIVLCFFSEQEIPYDYRDESAQRRIIAEQFAGQGWRTAELLQEVAASKSFYFDKLCQIRMPSWAKGRVALVGDAGYCASPAAGMGGSLALDGAAAFADSLRQHPNDLDAAFRVYDQSFRPFIDEVQAEAVRTGLETLVPRTEEAIRKRNAQQGQSF